MVLPTSYKHAIGVWTGSRPCWHYGSLGLLAEAAGSAVVVSQMVGAGPAAWAVVCKFLRLHASSDGNGAPGRQLGSKRDGTMQCGTGVCTGASLLILHLSWCTALCSTCCHCQAPGSLRGMCEILDGLLGMFGPGEQAAHSCDSLGLGGPVYTLSKAAPTVCPLPSGLTAPLP
jgi:hypothetical protein